MIHPRLLGLTLCCVLGWLLGCLVDPVSLAHAAGRARHRAAAAHRKAKPPKPVVRDTPAPSPAEPAPARAGGAPADTRAAAENRAPLRESVRQESRIEFDERMLRGQSAAGVIYLFRRTPSDWKSIVAVPDGFRDRTVNLLAPVEEKK